MCGAFLALAVAGYKPEQAPSFQTQETPLWTSLLASVFYLHGLVFNEPPRLNPPAWSLEIEIQFYLLAPFIVACAARMRSGWAPLLLSVSALVLVAAAFDHLFGQDALHQRTLVAHAYGFVLGVLVCKRAVQTDPFKQPPNPFMDWVGVTSLILLLTTGVFEHKGLTHAQEALRNLLRAVLLIGVFYGIARGPLLRRILGNKWLTTIGGMCYSIYLVHVPIMQFCAAMVFKSYSPTDVEQAAAIACLLLIPISLVGGALFYVLVERPCMERDWPSRLAKRAREGLEAVGFWSTARR